MTDFQAAPQVLPGRRVKWWKVAFFVMLVLFEIAREWAVMASFDVSRPNGSASVFSIDGFTVATGRWRRIDGGERLAPVMIKIECRRDLGKCIEASSTSTDGYFYAPEIDWFDAKFDSDAVTYQNDAPTCARYSVRIDLRLDKAFAVRERKNDTGNAACEKLEPRIEMQLGEGFDPAHNPMKGHFMPILALIRTLSEY